MKDNAQLYYCLTAHLAPLQLKWAYLMVLGSLMDSYGFIRGK